MFWAWKPTQSKVILLLSFLMGATSLVGCKEDYVSTTHGLAIGPICKRKYGDEICLGVKLVSYISNQNQSTVSANLALQNFEEINLIWDVCHIRFNVVHFTHTKPSDFGLRYEPFDFSELKEIRTSFDEPSTLSVILTGPWAQGGTLHQARATGWTELPPGGPFGSVITFDGRDHPTLWAHEIGHTLGLDHPSADLGKNLMNQNVPSRFFLPQSQGNIGQGAEVPLSPAQCNVAREAAETYWAQARR